VPLENTMHLVPLPQSEGFSWRDKSVQSDLLCRQQLDQWNQEGYLLLKGVISQETIKNVENLIDPLEMEFESSLRDRGGHFGISRADALTFSTHLVKRSEGLKRFTHHSVLADLCLNLLGPDARLYWDQAVYKKPGNPEEFPWHQDNGYTFVEPQDYLTCWIPLTPATIDNGCPWVIPKVHREGTYQHQMTRLGYQCVDSPEESVVVEAEPGDIVAFSSLTPHRTGPNLTEETRKAYIVQYAHDGSFAVAPNGELVAQSDPNRQFLILKDGAPVAYPEK
jgi:phytanoyl-CoA hydroxylase